MKRPSSIHHVHRLIHRKTLESCIELFYDPSDDSAGDGLTKMAYTVPKKAKASGPFTASLIPRTHDEEAFGSGKKQVANSEQFVWDPETKSLVEQAVPASSSGGKKSKEDEELLNDVLEINKETAAKEKKDGEQKDSDAAGRAGSDDDDEEDSNDSSSAESLPVSTPNLIGEALELGEDSMAYQSIVDKWIRDDKMANLFFYYHVAEKKLYCWNSDDWAMYRWRSNFTDMEFLHHAQIDTSNRGQVVGLGGGMGISHSNSSGSAGAGRKKKTGGPDLWITVIPPEVTTTVSRTTRVYEVPEKSFAKVFGKAEEEQGGTLEKMRAQSACGSAVFEKIDGKFGRQVKVVGTPRQITEFGNCIEQGLVSVAKNFDTKKWRKQQQEIHLERLKASGGYGPSGDTNSDNLDPDGAALPDAGVLLHEDADEDENAQNIAELSRKVAKFGRKYKLPLPSVRHLLKLDAQMQRYVLRKFKLPAENSKAEKVLQKYCARLSEYPQKWRLEALILEGDMDDLCDTRILRQGIDDDLEMGAESAVLAKMEEESTRAAGIVKEGAAGEKENERYQEGEENAGDGKAADGEGDEDDAPNKPANDSRTVPIPDGDRQLYGDVCELHAKVHDMFGYWHVTPLEDKIGIIVDGEKVRASFDGPQPLRDGSVVQIGKTIVLCEIGDSSWLTERRNKYYDKYLEEAVGGTEGALAEVGTLLGDGGAAPAAEDPDATNGDAAAAGAAAERVDEGRPVAADEGERGGTTSTAAAGEPPAKKRRRWGEEQGPDDGPAEGEGGGIKETLLPPE